MKTADHPLTHAYNLVESTRKSLRYWEARRAGRTDIFVQRAKARAAFKAATEAYEAACANFKKEG